METQEAHLSGSEWCGMLCLGRRNPRGWLNQCEFTPQKLRSSGVGCFCVSARFPWDQLECTNTTVQEKSLTRRCFSVGTRRSRCRIGPFMDSTTNSFDGLNGDFAPRPSQPVAQSSEYLQSNYSTESENPRLGDH